MKTQIREANADDLPRLAPLFDAYRVFYGQSSNAYAAQFFLSERMRRNESKIFIAVDAESFQTVGFTQLYPSFSSIRVGRMWILEDLYVRADARRTGVGNALMARAEMFAKETGAVGVTLSTATANAVAQALYEKRGYVRDTTFFVYNRYFPV
ncbi:MAG: GNAT family N-acetyltransferase [Candidatus Velthaea sp.]